MNLSVDSVKRYGFENVAEFNAFRYTDFGFQKFMEAASKESYFNNTVFVFIGDHGIPGNATDLFPGAWTNQRLAAFHVPFLIYSPTMTTPQRINAICSQVDVLPTIATYCGIPFTNTTLGRNVLSVPPASQFAFISDPDNSQAGVVKGDYYYRRNLRTKQEELVSITGNENIPDHLYRAANNELRALTTAMYEASKYLLLNNRKVR